MTRQAAIDLIDLHKNALIDPVAMLNWTWIRVIINSITDEEWDKFLERSMEIMTK